MKIRVQIPRTHRRSWVWQKIGGGLGRLSSSQITSRFSESSRSEPGEWQSRTPVLLWPLYAHRYTLEYIHVQIVHTENANILLHSVIQMGNNHFLSLYGFSCTLQAKRVTVNIHPSCCLLFPHLDFVFSTYLVLLTVSHRCHLVRICLILLNIFLVCKVIP